MTALILSLILMNDLPPIVPLDLDMEKYLPPAKPPVACTEEMSRFEILQTPVTSDIEIRYTDVDKKTHPWVLKPGYLISECELVQIVNTKVERDRLDLELKILKDLRIKEFQIWRLGEQQYRTRIQNLENQVQAATTKSWWDDWKAEIMFTAGVLCTVGVLAGTAEFFRSIQ